MLRPTLNSPQVPGGMPVFLPGGISVSEADARYLRKNGVQVNATDYLALGASPPASGAIRVDARSYGGIALNGYGGALPRNVVVGADDSLGVYFGSASDSEANIVAGNQVAWRFYRGSNIAYMKSGQATAQIIGGPTNGIAFRNSANTRDNWAINDAGTQAALYNGTQTAQMFIGSATGDMLIGARFAGAGGSSAYLLPDGNGTVGLRAGIAYFSGAGIGWATAAEVANVASGYGTLALMKSGGAVVIGTDPGGNAPWRVGGDAKIGGALILGNAYVAGAPAATGYVTLKDSTGTTYKLLCAA